MPATTGHRPSIGSMAADRLTIPLPTMNVSTADENSPRTHRTREFPRPRERGKVPEFPNHLMRALLPRQQAWQNRPVWKRSVLHRQGDFAHGSELDQDCLLEWVSPAGLSRMDRSYDSGCSDPSATVHGAEGHSLHLCDQYANARSLPGNPDESHSRESAYP